MASREWQTVHSTIADAVNGAAPLPGEAAPGFLPTSGLPERSSDTKQRVRTTWALTLAYFGPAFSGFAWQADAPLPTVSGALQEAIKPLLRGRHSLRLSCAGRTDAGVSATGQLASFYSWQPIEESELAAAIYAAAPAPGALRLVAARRVPRAFHATFSAAWRRYVYLLPALPGQSRAQVLEESARLDALLRPLAGTVRDYAALGRGVPKGKNTKMTIYDASAQAVELRGGACATRIVLRGDRFIRRQVRTLVATAVALADDEAMDGSRRTRTAIGSGLATEGDSIVWDQRLLEVCASGVQERTANPAPALGLCFAESLHHE